MTPRPPAPRRPLAPGLPLLRRPAPRPRPGPLSPAPALTPSPRLLLVIVVLVWVLIPGSAAYSETFEEAASSNETHYSFGRSSTTGQPSNLIYVQQIQQLPEVEKYMYFSSDPSLLNSPPADNYLYCGFTATYQSNVVGNGTAYFVRQFGSSGAPVQIVYLLVFDHWNPGSISGNVALSTIFDDPRYKLPGGIVAVSASTPPAGMYLGNSYDYNRALAGTHSTYSNTVWSNRLTISAGEASSNIRVAKNGHPSVVQIFDRSSQSYAYMSHLVSDDVDVWVIHPDQPNLAINIQSPRGIWYNRSFPAATSPVTVTVYIQNSQTGALLANSHLSILAAAGDPPELIEVVNATLPGGSGSYTLQPTGPTNPNPRYYKAVATVPGFSQIIDNHSFTLQPTGPHDVIIEMRPDTGGPANPENSFVDVYVRDIAGNPIPSATVQLGSPIRTTNVNGYVVFEVAKNNTYQYKVSKSGYVSIEGTATVGDDPRYPVNVVLGAGTVPTHTQTPGPGGPGATPTPTPTGWGPGQWTPDPGAGLGDNARDAAKSSLLQGLQLGQALFMITVLMVLMAVLRRGGK